jgi:hypothetical protein
VTTKDLDATTTPTNAAETVDDALLELIKRAVAGKSPPDILVIRDDIAGHIRSLESQHAADRSRGGFLPEHHYAPGQLAGEQQRLRRHKLELAYLNGLLG